MTEVAKHLSDAIPGALGHLSLMAEATGEDGDAERLWRRRGCHGTTSDLVGGGSGYTGTRLMMSRTEELDELEIAGHDF